VNSFELERFVSRQLRALPMPPAPRTLLPRVLAAARAWSERPWYAREWLTWPFIWQLGSVALLLLTLGGVAMVVPTMQSFLGEAMSSIGSTIEMDLPQLAGGLDVSANVLLVIWHALVQPFLPYAFVIIVLMCGACASVVFVLNRLVFGRPLQS
jgi:hypothetical protein